MKKTTTNRPYVAIKCEYVPDNINSIRCTAKKYICIEGVNGGVVSLKAGEVFYLVRSDSLGDNMFYVVRIDERGRPMCSCMATKPCRHERDTRERNNAY